MEQWLQLIGDTGFPIVVTMYLMHRIEGKLDVLIQTIQMLPVRMQEENRESGDRLSRIHLSEKVQ
ncbi:YvrJ family protein [Metabacillus sp. KIGAM252]|uniref:YvrJ family protein n=1 Tax=Metabacillus flavus TaxID=2823519 RepID=A0ABS5LDE3_9BACI|nr:YvrJ family protein [Metabacillus flavus]MBS2968609.1 YvrJ family protein [Metabacillus flavus]